MNSNVNNNETMAQWRARVIAEHYANHNRSEQFSGTMHKVPYECLQYWEEGSGIGWIEYFLSARSLLVTGDYGSAVYRFTHLNLREIAHTGYDYFCGKCVASEVGQRFVEWDPMLARRRLVQMRQACTFEAEGAPEDWVEMRQDWNWWLEHHGAVVLGDDWVDFSDLGERPHLRCILHLGGLKMFYELDLNEGG